ncbi:MAG: NERD domain-containing protein [Trueperaceae bacterium]|nr:NERD domain-containing protein [Trueperaceae bacterium]
MTTARPPIFLNPDRGGDLTPGEQHLLGAFTTAFQGGHLEGWKLYAQPHLNGDRPDFVLMNPNWGVLIIEVKDWDIEDRSKYAPVSIFIDEHGHRHRKLNPADQVKKYGNNIKTMYSRKFLDLLDEHPKYGWTVIEAAVYFHKASKERGQKFCGKVDYVQILDSDNIHKLANGKLDEFGSTLLKGFKSNPLSRKSGINPNLLRSFVEDLELWMYPTDNRENLGAIALSPEQEKDAKPALGISRRLKGAAGAGKTLVLATRAARILDQEPRQRVLLLTYNITLRFYIRDLVNLQYVGSEPNAVKDRLVIRHFHDFLKWVAEKHDVALPGIPKHATKEERSHILEVVWPRIVRKQVVESGRAIDPDCQFDAILIDEGQDFIREWALLTRAFFRSGQNQFLIAYDTTQDIYSRRTQTWLDAGGDVRGLGFRGPPAELKKTMRLPSTVAELARNFAQKYLGTDADAIEPNSQPELFKHFLRWANQLVGQEATLSETILTLEQTISKEMGAHRNDITILVENHDIALEVTKKLIANGHRVAHVFDLVGEHDHARRREQKWRFQPTTGSIKVSTIHSFKGWESPYIIAVFGSPNERITPNAERQYFLERAALIYVTLTRVKRNEGGTSGALVCYNFDPRFNGVAELFRAANEGQAELTMAPRR